MIILMKRNMRPRDAKGGEMKIMKRFLAIALTISMVSAVAGCSAGGKTENTVKETTTAGIKATELQTTGEETQGEEAQSDKEYYIGYSLCEYTMALAAYSAQLFEEECKSRGYKYTVTDGEKDPSKQIDDINALINMGVDALLIMPTDGQAVASGVEAAYEAGIPVVVVLRDMPTVKDKYLAFSGCDDIELGNLAGEWITNTLDGKGKIVYITGTPGLSTAEDRSKGFHEIVDKAEMIEIVAEQAGNYSRSTAMQVMEAILQANPEIDAVWCANDEMAGGVCQAIDAAGRSGIKVGGANLQKDAYNRILSGEQEADITTPPQMVIQGLDALITKLEGGTVEKRLLYPLDIVTKENAAEFEYQTY